MRSTIILDIFDICLRQELIACLDLNQIVLFFSKKASFTPLVAQLLSFEHGIDERYLKQRDPGVQ